MTRNEHLLTILAEECLEVAKRCSKALRFGIHEVQHGHRLSNAERIEEEFLDLIAIKRMCNEAGLCGAITTCAAEAHIEAKIAKVERFLEYSRECGTLVDGL